MVATLAAIELGSAEGVVACGLHPQWVLAQQAEKVEYALWAVQNCHDNDALAETRERAAQRVRASYTGAGTLVPPQLAEAPSFITYNDQNPLMHMPRDLETRGAAPYVINELIDGAIAVNAVATVTAIVNDYYGPRSGNALWAGYSVNIVALIARLTKPQREQVFRSLLTGLRAGRTKHAHVVDVAMIELLMKEIDAPNSAGLRFTYPGHYSKAFSAKAFDALLADPAWWHLLEVHDPSPKQFKKILARVGGDCREHWLAIIRETRILIRVALDYRGPGSLSEAERASLVLNCGHNITRLTSGKDDVFFTQVIAALGDKYTAMYVVNGLVVGHTREATARVFPENAEIASLVARVGDEAAWEEAYASSTNEVSGAEELRARALCEHVPGAWRLLISHPVLGDELREALLSSGLGLQEIVHRLYEKESPLYTFREAKAALGI
jgi:hypothetical protein